MAESKLTRALMAVLGDPGSAEERVQEVSREAIETAGQAELIVQLLKLFPLPPNPSAERAFSSPLHCVLAWMQGTRDEGARSVFRDLGAPGLLRILDESIRVAAPDTSRANDDLL